MVSLKVFLSRQSVSNDDALSHAANATRQFSEQKRTSGKKLMILPPASPDLTPVENLWAIVKIYVGGRQDANNQRGALGCHLNSV